jgi:uncharacterized protein YoxC
MADEIHDDEHPAEPIELRRFDMHSTLRMLLWGASATMAVAVVAGTAFSDTGAERLKQTVASLFDATKTGTSQPTPQVAQQPEQTVTTQQIAALEKQTRELTQTVRDLTADRDRIQAKLASVEQSLDDITGSIKRQTAQAGQFSAQLAAQTAALTAPHATVAAPPVVSAPQTVAAIPSPTATSTAAPDTPVTTAITPPAVEASPPLEGPIPLPPMRTAAIEENAPAVRELAVDVGGAASLDALRTHWAALKANVGPDIVGLLPSYVAHQKQTGGTDYRLVLGPVPNATAALRLCAKLIAARVNCRAGTFNVQRLANAAPAQAVPRAAERLPSPATESIISR